MGIPSNTEAVTNAEVGRVDEPDHITGICSVDRLPVVAEHLMGVFGGEGLPGAVVDQIHPPGKFTRTDPHVGDVVPMPWVEVRLHLEDEAGEVAVDGSW